MKARSFLVMLPVFFSTACAPYRIDHRHLVFDDTTGLKVLERSTTAVDSQGKPLKHGKVGFPTKVVLNRERYSLNFDIPADSIPMVFLSARAADGDVLVIEGPFLPHVYPKSATELMGYQYSFYVKEANCAPMELAIRAADGAELGRERLTYKIRSRGVACGIEWP